MWAFDTHTVIGKSGSEYYHSVYVIRDVSKLKDNGIYIVYKDTEIVVERHKYEAIYVGKAIDETIAERFSGSHGERTDQCFKDNEAHFIGVVSIPEGMTADAVEIDLIKGLDPVCNIQHRESGIEED